MGSLTLPLANTPYNVLALVNAAIQAEGGAAAGATISGSSRIFYVECNPGIDGAGANTNDVLLGEAVGANASNLLTNNRYGRVLKVGGGGFTYQSTGNNNVDWINYWVQSAGVAQKINVLIHNG